MTISLNLKNGSVGQSTSNYSWLSHTKDNLTAELRVGIDSNNQRYINGIADYISLPKIQMPTIKKQDNNLEGGEIHFEPADNEVNAGKPTIIDRYDGKIRIVGADSNDNIRCPLQADVQNDCVNITNAYINNTCCLQKNSTNNRYIVKDLGYAQGDTVSALRYNGISIIDKNNVEIGSIHHYVSAYDNTNGDCYLQFMLKSPIAGSKKAKSLGLYAGTDGDIRAYAPFPVDDADVTEIVTAGWVRRRMRKAVGNEGPTTITTLYSGGQGTGDIILSKTFKYFDAIYIWFADDNNANTFTKLWYTWELDRALKDYMHTKILLFGNASSYWYVYNYSNGSTDSMFKCCSENCYVNRIEGLIW